MARFFGISWTRYDLSRTSMFRLVPGAERISSLRRDNRSMSVMYLSESARIEKFVEQVVALEIKINQKERVLVLNIA